MKGGTHYLSAKFDDLNYYEELESIWVEGLSGVSLTSVGRIVGGISFNSIFDRDYEMPTLVHVTIKKRIEK